jgi:hypothetical protein
MLAASIGPGGLLVASLASLAINTKEVPLSDAQIEGYAKLVVSLIGLVEPGDPLQEVSVVTDDSLVPRVCDLTGKPYTLGGAFFA